MPKVIFLDSAPLSTLANPAQTAEVRAMAQWLAECDLAGHHVVIPEIVDYEVRRELLRSRKTSSITELDNLKNDLMYLPLNTAALLKAAELWADIRQKGNPTAHDENIDVDVILAAQVLTLGMPETDLVVATVNLRHLSLFVPADLWSNITP
jgi:predicted nucleic acid-binding protein